MCYPNAVLFSEKVDDSMLLGVIGREYDISVTTCYLRF